MKKKITTQMQNAIDAALNDNISIRAAAEKFGIPRTTLQDNIKRKKLFKQNQKPEQKFSQDIAANPQKKHKKEKKSKNMTWQTNFITSIGLYSSEEKLTALKLIEDFICFLEKRIQIKNADIFIQIIKEFALHDLISITFEDFIFFGANLIAFLPFQTKQVENTNQRTIELLNENTKEKSNKTTKPMDLICLFLDYFEERVETRHMKELKCLFQSFCHGNADKKITKFTDQKNYVMSIIPCPKYSFN